MTHQPALFRYARLIVGLTALDLKIRFAGSKLGLAWLVLAPALTVCAYVLLFGAILKVEMCADCDRLSYGLLMVTGLLPWIGFAESVSRGTASVLAHRNLMKSRVFPMELIPVTAVCTGVTGQLAGTIVLICVLCVFGKLSVTILFFPVLIMLQALLTVGLVWFLSCVNIIYRDTSQMVSLGLLLLMFLSPIAYTPDMMPKELAFLLAANPLALLIEGYRDIFLFGRLPALNTMGVFAGLAVLASVAGHLYFMRLRRLLPDCV
ncbi:ABC transporter permease [Nitrospira sp. Nam80]